MHLVRMVARTATLLAVVLAPVVVGCKTVMTDPERESSRGSLPDPDPELSRLSVAEQSIIRGRCPGVRSSIPAYRKCVWRELSEIGISPS